MKPYWKAHSKRLSSAKITTPKTARNTASGHGSTVPSRVAIHSGGSRRTESITQPTNTGGIKSSTLLRVLETQDHEKNRQWGRR